MRKILFVFLSVLCTKSVAQEIERADSIDLETGIICRANGGIDSLNTDGHEDFPPPVAQIPLDECDSLTAGSPIDRYGIVWKGGKCGIYDISKYENVTRIEYKDLWFSFRKEIEGEYYSYFGWEEDDSMGVIGVAEANNQFIAISMPKDRGINNKE